jgi:short-subunit dehydrogenase
MDVLEKRYALVTGATGGLGKAFVFELAKRGYALILTGRSEEKLAVLQSALQEKHPQTQTHYIAVDLCDETQRKRLMQAIEERGLKIDLLVNAAGADIQKPFISYTQDKIAFQCRANFEAAVALCHFAIERKAERLEIVNISSVSGIYPMPYFAIYSATKGALTSFSVALREEMKGKGVAVTAVLPGAMPTREDIKEQIKGQGLWGRLAVKTPEWVATYALKAVKKNKRKVIPGGWNKCMRLFTAWMPQAWKLKFIAKRWSKISKDAF